jgi:hypothetical protein
MSGIMLDFVCQCGEHEEDVWIERGEDGLPLTHLCVCGKTMNRVFNPIRTKFGDKFFAGMRARRISCSWTDEDGKKHEKDLTNAVGDVFIGEKE